MRSTRGAGGAGALLVWMGRLVLLALLPVVSLWPAPGAAQMTRAGLAAQLPAVAGAEVMRVPAGRHKVALTFDAGEWPGRVDTILATLNRHGVRATFFLCGIYIDNFPSRARAIAGAGEELASHSYHNVDHRGLSNRQIINEVQAQEAALQRVTGLHNTPYWRAPYGYRDARVLQVVNSLGYRSVQWSLDSLDTIAPPKTANFIFQRLTGRPVSQLDGAVILLHVNPDGTVNALNRVLDYFDAVGLRQVTVSELLQQ